MFQVMANLRDLSLVCFAGCSTARSRRVVPSPYDNVSLFDGQGNEQIMHVVMQEQSLFLPHGQQVRYPQVSRRLLQRSFP